MSGTNKKIKFAIIGCGRISYRHIEAIHADPRAELVALCDLNLERARERAKGKDIAVYRDYNEMLAKEEIDVVSIMTPSGMHAEHALEIIAKYGKHLVIEKPMCLKVSDGLELIRLAEKEGVRLFIAHQNRYNKAVQKVKSAIDSNLFGRIVLATVRIRWARGQAYYDRDPWRGRWAFDGGALTNQSVHHIDLLRWLVGDVSSLSAVGGTQLVEVEVEDTACAWLKFKSGALGAIEATTAARPLDKDLEASISILGENGAAIIEGASVNKLTLWNFKEDIDLAEYSEEPPNVYGFGHDHIIKNVTGTLLDGAAPFVSAQDALSTIKLLNAIYSSIEQSSKIVHLSENPLSARLGVIAGKDEEIADLYRTSIALGKKR